MAIDIGSKHVAATINVTPLIDVLLVLLIIFMLLPSPTHGLKSEVPQPAPDNHPILPNPQHVVLRIAGDRSIEINSKPVLGSELEERLKSLFAVRPEGVLFVDGSGELEFADIASVVDLARGAGVDRIGLMTARSPYDQTARVLQAGPP